MDTHVLAGGVPRVTDFRIGRTIKIVRVGGTGADSRIGCRTGIVVRIVVRILAEWVDYARGGVSRALVTVVVQAALGRSHPTRGRFEGCQLGQVDAGIMLGPAVGVVGQVGALEYSGGGSVCTAVPPKEDLADGIDPRHGHPIEEVTAPLALGGIVVHTGAGIVAVLVGGERFGFKTIVAVGIALVTIEVAVIIVGVLVGRIRDAVAIQIGVIAEGLEIQLVVLGGVDHHSRLHSLLDNVDRHGTEVLGSVILAGQGSTCRERTREHQPCDDESSQSFCYCVVDNLHTTLLVQYLQSETAALVMGKLSSRHWTARVV